MKKINSIISIFVIALLSWGSGFSQTTDNAQSVEVRFGKSLMPAMYAAIKYERVTSTPTNVSAKLFYESMQKNSLDYSCFGLDILGDYYTPVGDNTDHLFECKLGFGGTVQIENEPWVYKEYPVSNRLNYGLVGEFAGEWAMSEAFSLTTFLQQKYLFNKNLSHTNFLFGVGIKFNIPD
ncbi:MAG: hypothetical protein V4539_08630 [Bacteroidota bacterium]